MNIFSSSLEEYVASQNIKADLVDKPQTVLFKIKFTEMDENLPALLTILIMLLIFDPLNVSYFKHKAM